MAAPEIQFYKTDREEVRLEKLRRLAYELAQKPDSNALLDVGVSVNRVTRAVDFPAAVRLRGYTVATLPTGVVGDTAYVTDALAPAFGATVAGTGAVKVPVFFDGTNWIVG